MLSDRNKFYIAIMLGLTVHLNVIGKNFLFYICFMNYVFPLNIVAVREGGISIRNSGVFKSQRKEYTGKICKSHANKELRY